MTKIIVWVMLNIFKKKNVTVKTVCVICNKDLKKSFKVDFNKSESALRHYKKDGKVLSHGYCQECYDTFVQSQIDDYKAALAKAAV